MKSKIKGLTMLVFISIILVVATLIPSVSAAESTKAHSRYKLVSESVSGSYKTCLYRNTRGETKSTSISKGKRCPATY